MVAEMNFELESVETVIITIFDENLIINKTDKKN